MATIDIKRSLEQRLQRSVSPNFRHSVSRFPSGRVSRMVKASIPDVSQSAWCNCDITSKRPFWLPSGEGRASIFDLYPSGADEKEIKRLLGQAPAIRKACDLDLLLFLHRHPRTLLTSEQLAAFVGYDIQVIARSLEAFIEANLLERTQNRTHAARMYLLVLDGPQNGGIRELLKLASTRNGRHNILQALDPGGPQPEAEAPQRGPQLMKIA